MPHDATQILAAAQEWMGVADCAGRVGAVQVAIAERVVSAHVRATERLLSDGPHGAVDELGQALVDVIEQVGRLSEPVDELVSTAGARIASLRIEVAALRGELDLEP